MGKECVLISEGARVGLFDKQLGTNTQWHNDNQGHDCGPRISVVLPIITRPGADFLVSRKPIVRRKADEKWRQHTRKYEGRAEVEDVWDQFGNVFHTDEKVAAVAFTGRVWHARMKNVRTQADEEAMPRRKDGECYVISASFFFRIVSKEGKQEQADQLRRQTAIKMNLARQKAKMLARNERRRQKAREQKAKDDALEEAKNNETDTSRRLAAEARRIAEDTFNPILPLCCWVVTLILCVAIYVYERRVARCKQDAMQQGQRRRSSLSYPYATL